MRILNMQGQPANVYCDPLTDAAGRLIVADEEAE